MAKAFPKKTVTPALPEDSPSKPGSSAATSPQKKKPWTTFIREADDREIAKRFLQEVRKAAEDQKVDLEKVCLLLYLDPDTAIGPFDLNRLFQAITRLNSAKDKDVVLVLCSPGGSIEPAYQISKLCKSYSANTFRVLVPRFAKSAATLISLGADEIHMGPLSQLGPIDPQIGGLPALGISRALTTIAQLAQTHPGSAEMFATYLHKALTVEQIGFCERISESAEQYAERLLETKSKLPRKPGLIAKELVHEYKDHAFVIDLDEARAHLGTEWIFSDTQWSQLGESIYRLFETVNTFLQIFKNKRMLVAGDLADSVLILEART